MHATSTDPGGPQLLTAFHKPLFVCPSDDGPLLNDKRWLGPTAIVIDSPEVMQVAKGNYVGINRSQGPTGFANLTGVARNQGMFEAANTPVELRSCRDGTSNVAMTSERAWSYRSGGTVYESFAANQLMNRSSFDQLKGQFTEFPDLGTGSSDTCASAHDGQMINFPHLNPESARDTLSSNHPGGVNIGFVDGSVHFVADRNDIINMQNLCDKRDGQALTEIH